MNSFRAVFKREFKSYFTTPLAYVFLVVFLFFAGYLTFKQGFFEARQADLRAFFVNLPLLFVFMVPATAMRLWAEERKTGSGELLLTLPVTVVQAVMGKFLAAWLFLFIALALTFPMVITVCYLGDPDIGLIITGYLGSLLMAGGFLARLPRYRLLLLGRQQKPGHKFRPLCRCLCSPRLRRHANNHELPLDVLARRLGLGN
jgi:ABC-2 type transport system permease protein